MYSSSDLVVYYLIQHEKYMTSFLNFKMFDFVRMVITFGIHIITGIVIHMQYN